MSLVGREVEINKPGQIWHGMTGKVLSSHDGAAFVSLHGESERHEGPVVPFVYAELLFLKVEVRDRVEYRIPWPLVAFLSVVAFIAGAGFQHWREL